MLDDDPVARHLIAVALGDVIDETIREHAGSITQEPQLTSRIGQALEQKLDGQTIMGRHIQVLTQDIPDRGPGALEGDLGADIYVGIQVEEEGRAKSKGFLVQAKYRRKLRGAKAGRELAKACSDMHNRTDAAYVWIYGDNDVRVLDASQILDAVGRPLELPARRASTLFAGVLECHEGALDLGLPGGETIRAQRAALGQMLNQLRVPQGVAVTIE